LSPVLVRVVSLLDVEAALSSDLAKLRPQSTLSMVDLVTSRDLK